MDERCEGDRAQKEGDLQFVPSTGDCLHSIPPPSQRMRRTGVVGRLSFMHAPSIFPIGSQDRLHHQPLHLPIEKKLPRGNLLVLRGPSFPLQPPHAQTHTNTHRWGERWKEIVRVAERERWTDGWCVCVGVCVFVWVCVGVSGCVCVCLGVPRGIAESGPFGVGRRKQTKLKR